MASSGSRRGPQIDFERLKAALVDAAERLVEDWFPGGRREGHEFKVGNLRGDKGRSLSINLTTGAWADFANAKLRGNDLISLYAAKHGLEQIDAAIDLARQLRVGITEDDDRQIVKREQPEPPPAPAKVERRAKWEPVIPVPEDAPPPPVAHLARGRPERSWRYLDREGRLLGVVNRFKTSDGGKEVLPVVWAKAAGSERHEWRWMHWSVPRPLYGLDRLREDLPILIVEGEKCADAGHEALRGTFCVLSWPGGGNAVRKADWEPLKGRSVIVWPDCDAQRYKEGHELEGQMKPEAEQPGVAAAEAVAEQIVALGGKVRIVKIPPPGAKSDGWDIADAIAEGWNADQLKAFLRDQRAPACDKQEPPPTEARASAPKWRRQLLQTNSGVPRDCRENVIVVLRDHPAWQGVLGWNEFAARVETRRPAPTGQPPGHVWTDQDDIELGLWLSRDEALLVRSTDTIAQAIGYVSRLHRFHPVREYLQGLQWDGKARVSRWVIDYLSATDSHYHRLVGTFFLINLVRRIFEPGCIMRSVMVLEGGQNLGKSTLLRDLTDPWYSDTMFRVGDKDSYQLIQGVWLYEISELESFTRSEATAVKAFISSTSDKFRAPYDRRPETHPRQVAFAGTTNAVEYLKDFSGNTRFWPVSVGASIDRAGLAAVRDQLWAEAVNLVRAGARSYPSREEEDKYFREQQDQRQVEHPWVEKISDYLSVNALNKVSVRALLEHALGVDLARASPNGAESQRVGQIMQQLGWRKLRESEPPRRWYWAAPEAVASQDAEDASDLPF